MRKVFTRVICGIIGVVLSTALANAQTVDTLYSGDMNNNGIVNAVDLLYWGQEFGETGPPRVAPSSAFIPNVVGVNNKFGKKYKDDLYEIDIVHGDANGDGTIDDLDFDQVFVPNHGLMHGDVLPDGYMNGQLNVDPPLRLVASSTVVEEGDSLTIAIELGDTAFPIDDFYGIAFTMDYEKEFTEDSAPFELIEDGNGWTNTIGADTRQFINRDELTGRAEYAIVKTDKQGINIIKETVGVFSIIIDDIIVLPTTADTILTVTIDSVRVIDAQFRTIPIALSGTDIEITVINTERSSSSDCPDTFAPVCAGDGNTYYNSCYAEAAGVVEYTSGTCFSDCIDPDLISSEVCTVSDFDQVCGCNGKTYINECHAEMAGITAYTAGPCNTESDCVDINSIISSGFVKRDIETGELSNNCSTTLVKPVCGCNGVTYQNSCFAEVSGITSYTPGSCATACIDPTQINPTATCVTTYDPVCGCNDVTYNNFCYAEAAGVQSYTQGVCNTGGGGGTTTVIDPWCQNATPVFCGDILFNQTNAGENNDFSSYSILPNYTLLAPDKIYNLNKTTTGDLQITLEITTPGLDLDLFLLQGDCNNYIPLAGSWSNNQVTSIETIIVDDAPLGNYYIVVDGQYPASVGDFRLDISCGYLDCSNAIDLECGHPHNYTNAYGEDNISVYNCDGANAYNNSGPEVVHTVTTTATGQLDITLSNLNANLNMYLLSACDNNDCIDNSTNAGTWNEQITAYVPAGTYYIVVDGYNGATSSYNLYVDCAQTCDINVNAAATYSSCGQNSGTITVSSTGGTAGYTVDYTGPVSGSLYTYNATCTISNLPPGTYTVSKTDANGCSDYAVVTINDGSNLDFNYWVTDATCGMGGAIEVSMSNGAAPYTVTVTGPKNLQLTAYSNSININDLLAGTYTIQVLDAYGCSSIQQVTVGDSNSGFTYTATPNPANCGQLGSITVNIPAPYNTQNPFNIQLNGPVSGFETTNSSSFNIVNLPGGTYNLTVENEFWCQESQVVVIDDNYMTIGTTTSNGICGQDGAISVSISNGTSSYYVQWSGQESGNSWVSNPNYTINNLSSGVYTVSVTDDNGCTDYEVVQLDNSNSYLNTAAIGIDGSCGYGSIWVDMLNGNAPYTVSWSGSTTGVATTSNDGFDIQNVPVGSYTVTIIDTNGCTSTEYVTVNGGGSDISITATGSNGYCGTNGSIWIGISNGEAPYTVVWDGTSSGATSTSSPTYDIGNLGSGTYIITISDTNGCSDTETVTINNSNVYLNIFTSVTNASCGTDGSVWGTLSGGTPTYTLTWDGPVSGSTTITDDFDIQNLPAGNYTLTATDANGCTTSKVISVYTEASDLEIAANAINENCGTAGSIWLSITGGTAPYSIAWSGAASGSSVTSNNNFDIQNLWAGTHSVIVTDANGCTDAISVTISGYQGLVLNATSIDCMCGTNGSVWLGIEGGVAPYLVTWQGQGINDSASTVDQNFDIQNLPCGSYDIIVADANGCTKSITSTINEGSSNLDISLWGTDGVCGGYGSIEVSIAGGSSAYDVSWSGASTGSANTNNSSYVISSLPQGSYTVNVTDANGCVSSKDITIGQSNNLDISLWGTDGVCGGYGSIEVSIAGGSSAYDVSWSGASTGSANTNNSSYVISSLPQGSYTVNVTDANGCVSSKNITIGQSNNLDISLWGTDGVCGGYGSIEVSIAGGSSAYDVSWSGASTGSANTNNSSYVISSLPQGSYTVNVTDANGCVSSKNITIGQSNNLDISLWGTDGVCGGYGSIEVSIAGGSSAYDVSWSGASTGSANTNNSSYVISSLPQGSYTVNVTDANGCVSSKNITIGQSNNLDISLWGTDGVCGGYGSIEVSIAGGSSAYDVSWSGASTGSANTNNSSYVISSLPQGSYTVNVTDANGCVSSKNITIGQTNGLNVSLDGNDGVCGGYGSIEVSIAGSNGSYIIAWDGPSNGTTTTNNNPYTISNLTAGNYSVTVTDVNGCSDIQLVSVYDIYNNLSVNATATNGVCGQNGSIWVNITGGNALYTVAWTGPENGTATTANSTYDINDLSSGTYIISVTDDNGCTVTQSVNVSNGNNSLSVSTEVVNGTCGNMGSIWVNFNAGVPEYLISWNGPSNGTATTSANAYAISNLVAGDYTISVSDLNGCTYSETLYVQVSGGNFAITTSAVNGACGSNGSIDITMNGGTPAYNVSWSGPVSGSTTINGNAHSIPNLPTGSYNVMVVDGSGCGQSESIYVGSGNGSLSVSTVSYPAYCNQTNSGSAWLDINGGTAPFNISWTGISNGNDMTSNDYYEILALSAGTYTVVVMDANGCSDTEIITIDSNGGNVAFTATSSNVYCNAAGSVTVNVTSGTANYIIEWSGPTQGSTFTANSTYEILNAGAGTYTISVTDANGCSATETVVVNSSGGNLSLNTTATDSYCGVPGSVWVAISGGSAAYTIAWSGADSGSITTSDVGYSIPNLGAGDYVISVTDANGCSSTSSVTINGTGGTLGATITPSAAYCSLPGSIWIIINNGNPSYTVTWTGPSSGSAVTGTTYDIPNLPAGTYTVTIEDANGCSITQTLVIENNASSLAVTANPTNAACGVAGSIWLTMSGGAAPYAIEWTGTSAGNATSSGSTYDLNNLSAGTYNITVTDNNDCSVSETVTVSSSGNNLAINANPTNSVCGVPGSIWVTVTGGSADYTIEWNGTATGTTTTNSSAYDISGLSMGDYGITVTDATGCSAVQTVSISGSIALDAIVSPHNGSCNGSDGEITVVVNNGSPNYAVFWNGPVTNSAILTGNTITIDNLPSGDYNVAVEDANGCSYSEVVTITNAGGSPTADYAYTTDVLTFTGTNNSDAGTYSWDFDDGNTSTDTNPVYAFCEEGTYNVCLTVTNSCGTNTSCEMVTVTIPSNVCTLDVGEVSTTPGSTVYVPVTIRNCNLIVSLAGSLNVFDTSIATIAGLSPGAISPQYNSVDQTFNYYDNNGTGITVANDEILFYLVVQVASGTTGQSTNIQITNSPLMIEIGTIINGNVTTVSNVALKGSISVDSSAQISGLVHTYWSEGVKDVSVNFINDNTNSTFEMTDENGEYMHPNVPLNNMYTVQPEKDGNDPNGLSTFALFVGQRFILGMEPIEITSPYQVIAGDANCSGSFTTLDLFLIQQIIIGTNNELNDCPSWVFVKSDADMPIEFNSYNVFPYENSETMMVTEDALVDFVGVKVGDILGHANPQNFGGAADDRLDTELKLQVDKKSYAAGETVELNFRSPNFANMVSYQMGLKFNNNKLTFMDYQDPANPSLSSTAIGTNDAVKGDLRISWFSTNGSGINVEANEQLFTLRFTANEAIDNIEALLSVNSDNILSEAHNGDLEVMDIIIEFVEEQPTTAVTTLDVKGYDLAQNTPNPFNDNTVIVFELPTAMKAQIVVHNQLGEVVHTIENDFQKGQNTVSLSQKEIGVGVFYYTLKTNEFSATRAMISIE